MENWDLENSSNEKCLASLFKTHAYKRLLIVSYSSENSYPTYNFTSNDSLRNMSYSTTNIHF